MNQTDPTAARPPMSRGANAEALLLRFTAEAHRRKWSYDRGLDDDGVPLKSEAFDALHRLGEEMRTALEELRRTPAAGSAVLSPPTDQAALHERIAEAARTIPLRLGPNAIAMAERGEPIRLSGGEAWAVAIAVLGVLPPPADRAAVLLEAAEKLHAQGQHLTGEFNGSDILHEDGPAAAVATWKRAADLLRRLAAEAQQQNSGHVCKPGANVYHCPTSGQTESDCHGGFTTCCERPDLHQPAAEAQQQKPTTADKAAALGMTDTEFRARSHRAAVDAIRAAMPGLYATVALRVDDALTEAQQQPTDEAPTDEPPTEEQIVRDHVTTLHLIGEQLAEVESWMWQHLADVRDAAAEPCLCGHMERRHRRQRAGWTREACSDCPCDDYVAAIPVQPAAADTEETCDGCGHPKHSARECPVTQYGERCACDEPITPEEPRP